MDMSRLALSGLIFGLGDLQHACRVPVCTTRARAEIAINTNYAIITRICMPNVERADEATEYKPVTLV